MTKLKGDSGQATLEGLIAFPVILIFVSTVSLSFYGTFAEIIFEHWTQQAVLCMAKNNSQKKCLKQYQQKLLEIPFLSVQVLQFQQTQQWIRVRLQASWFHQKTKNYSYHIPWPIQKL